MLVDVIYLFYLFDLFNLFKLCLLFCYLFILFYLFVYAFICFYFLYLMILFILRSSLFEGIHQFVDTVEVDRIVQYIIETDTWELKKTADCFCYFSMIIIYYDYYLFDYYCYHRHSHRSNSNRYGSPPASAAFVASLSDEVLTDDTAVGDCAICQEDFHAADTVKRFPCELHVFHTGCIVPWLSEVGARSSSLRWLVCSTYY